MTPKQRKEYGERLLSHRRHAKDLRYDRPAQAEAWRILADLYHELLQEEAV